MSEAFIFMGSLDDAGDIGNGDPAVFREINDADDGVQSGEGVGSGFGMGRGYGTEEGGFPGIRIPDKSDIGNRAEFEVKPALFAGVTLGVLAGHPVGGAFEVGVSLAAISSFAKQELLSILGQVGNGFLLGRLPVLLAGPVDDRAHGNPHNRRRTTSAVLVFPFSMAAAPRTDERLEKKRDKIVDVVAGLQDNVSPFAAVAAVRTAVGDEFFSAEAAASVAPVPGLGVNANLVNKSHVAGSLLEIGGRVE